MSELLARDAPGQYASLASRALPVAHHERADAVGDHPAIVPAPTDRLNDHGNRYATSDGTSPPTVTAMYWRPSSM